MHTKGLLLVAATAMMAIAVADARTARTLLADHADDATVAPAPTPLNGSLSLYNISGVWVGVGDQYDAHVWAAYFEENALPVCGEKAHYTYKHWGEDLPDTVALAANGMGINGHEAGTYLWSEVTFDGAYLKYKPDWDPETMSCARFMPYVDARNGMVYASAISKTEWKKSGDEVVQTDMSCTVDAFEAAGCHKQDDDTVHTVAVTTYRCVAGACAGYAPAVVEKLEALEEDEEEK